MDEWDSENFEPPSLTLKPVVAGDKWAGEDEDDDVKDNWEDDDEEEKKDEEKPEIKAVQVKKKKTLSEKIEEKEKIEREERARKQAVKEAMKNLTPAEKAAERLRQQKLQEEADLQVTKETFGIIEPELPGIDSINPTTEEEFSQLEEALHKKLQNLATSPHFVVCLENLVRRLCVDLNSNDLKKLKTTVTNVYTEKLKVETTEKTKKNKGKGKARLKIEGDNEYAAFGAAEYDEFDDFM